MVLNIYIILYYFIYNNTNHYYLLLLIFKIIYLFKLYLFIYL